MLLKNNFKKYKEAPESIKQIVGLVGLTTIIIFTFIILNIFIDESDKVVETVKTEEINKVITSLPRGRLNFYESTEGHQL
jgi:predicted transcriptional regulator